jgi:hypothetical protein
MHIRLWKKNTVNIRDTKYSDNVKFERSGRCGASIQQTNKQKNNVSGEYCAAGAWADNLIAIC